MKIIIITLILLLFSCSVSEEGSLDPYKSTEWKVYENISKKNKTYSLKELKSLLGEPTKIDDKLMWEHTNSYLLIKLNDSGESISAYWGNHY